MDDEQINIARKFIEDDEREVEKADAELLQRSIKRPESDDGMGEPEQE